MSTEIYCRFTINRLSLFTAQHVSNISTSIFRGLRLILDLFHVLYFSGTMCVGVTALFGWAGVVSLCRLKIKKNVHLMEIVTAVPSITTVWKCLWEDHVQMLATWRHNCSVMRLHFSRNLISVLYSVGEIEAVGC